MNFNACGEHVLNSTHQGWVLDFLGDNDILVNHWVCYHLFRHVILIQCSHRLEKYLNLEGFLEKSLKIKSALKNTGKSLKGLEKSLNSSIFCRA